MACQQLLNIPPVARTCAGWHCKVHPINALKVDAGQLLPGATRALPFVNVKLPNSVLFRVRAAVVQCTDANDRSVRLQQRVVTSYSVVILH